MQNACETFDLTGIVKIDFFKTIQSIIPIHSGNFLTVVFKLKEKQKKYFFRPKDMCVTFKKLQYLISLVKQKRTTSELKFNIMRAALQKISLKFTFIKL